MVLNNHNQNLEIAYKKFKSDIEVAVIEQGIIAVDLNGFFNQMKNLIIIVFDT